MAIIGASVGLAALILTSIVGLRGEVRAVRTEMRAEIRDWRVGRGDFLFFAGRRT